MQTIRHGSGRNLQPAGDDDVISSAQHAQPSLTIQIPQVAAFIPTHHLAVVHFLSEGGGGESGIAQIPGGHHVTAEPDPAVSDGQAHALERDAVVHATAAGFAHAIGGDYVQPGTARGLEQHGVQGAAAEQNRVETAQNGQRFGARVGQQAAELRGDQRGETHLVGQLEGGLGERFGGEPSAQIHGPRAGSGEQAAHQNLQPGHVIHG